MYLSSSFRCLHVCLVHEFVWFVYVYGVVLGLLSGVRASELLLHTSTSNFSYQQCHIIPTALYIPTMHSAAASLMLQCCFQCSRLQSLVPAT